MLDGDEDAVEEHGRNTGRVEEDAVVAEAEKNEMQWQRKESRRRAEGENGDYRKFIIILKL